MKIERHLICYWLLVVAVLTLTSTGKAQTEGRAGFAVSMELQVLSGNPGSTVDGVLSIVATRTPAETRYDLEALDLSQTPEGVVRPVDVGAGTRPCAEWISLPASVTIPAGGGTGDVPFTVSIPTDAHGTYYTFIAVSFVPEEPEHAQTAVFIRPKLMMRLELEVIGRQVITLSVTSLSFEHDLVQGRPGVLVEIKNEGTVKTAFEGDVLLYGKQKRFPYRLEIPPDAQGKALVIYPGMTRNVRCLISEVPREGEYRAEIRLRMADQWRARSAFDIVVPPRGTGMSLAAQAGVKAECDLDVHVRPNYVDVSLMPGATRVGTVTIENRDSVAVNLRASVMGVVQETNGFLTYSELDDSTRPWVRVSPTDLVVMPHSTRNLMLNITAPEFNEGANPVCAVRILGNSGTDETGWVSEVDQGIQVVAVQATDGPAELEITRLEVIRQGEENNATATVLAVKNVGGQTAELKGSLLLERAGSRDRIMTMYISDVDGLILTPGTTREFRVSLPNLDRDKFRLKAELSAAGNPNSLISAEKTFVCTQGPGAK